MTDDHGFNDDGINATNHLSSCSVGRLSLTQRYRIDTQSGAD